MSAAIGMDNYYDLYDWYECSPRINEDGSGSAEVLQDPDDDTICARFSTWDKAYRDFARHVFYDAVDVTHLPRMYAFEESDNNECYVVVMEVLEHLDCDDALWTLCEQNWNTDWVDEYGYGDVDDALAAIRAAFAGYNRLYMITRELLELQHELYELCFDYGHCMDLHEFNVMVRPGPRRDSRGRFCKREADVAVITDPWC